MSSSLRHCAPVTVSWGVVVPVKRLALAKSRLSSFGDDLRQDLALAFAADVVEAALGCRDVVEVLVVTDDLRAAAALAALGARIAPDGPGAGLNPALVHGSDLLRAGDAALGVATLSADLPALRPQDLATALLQVATGSRAFVADAAGDGTTLLAAGPSASLRPAFGPASRRQHLDSGAVELVAAVGLRHDVDTPTDLALVLRLGVGRHTAALAAQVR